uniref:myosin light chain kinase family member 4-like n=1 Tax=Myxine glutinosa TaxID=7769 RepID=UPI00358FDFB2
MNVFCRGDFGPVFKVVQRTTGQAAEAKFKRLPRFVRRQEALREIEMLFLFAPHPNLLLLHDAYQMLDSKEIVLITEPLQGCSLLEWLVSGKERVTERICAGYLRQLCSALKHLHAASIMHLDLKPESLQLACSGELKLTGFAVARRCGEEPSLLRGDAEFSAPEQLGSEAATINTDMWPVGLLAIVVRDQRLPQRISIAVSVFEELINYKDL